MKDIKAETVRPIVFISCALRGDLNANFDSAVQYVRDRLLAGEVPVCPVTMYTLSVSMQDEDEVTGSFWAAVECLRRCDKLYVYVKNGYTSSGMQWEINWWRNNKPDAPIEVIEVDY